MRTSTRRTGTWLPGAALALVGAFAAPDAMAQVEDEEEEDVDTALTTLDGSLQPLIDAFNREKDKPRILALLSPT